MKKKTLIRSIIFTFFCCIMILGFQTNVKAETGNYYIKVNKNTNVVTVYTKDDRPYTAFVCSAGYATPVGTFYTSNKYSWWVLDGPCYGQYCTRITGSILFHSVWYYQQNKTTQSYVQYNKLGSLASHGCVRITTAAAKWIYDNCPLQTKVIIFNGSSSDDPLGKPAAIKVNSSVRMGWDPTDPDPNNTYHTKNTQPRISVQSQNVNVQYNAPFTPVAMTAYDSAGNELSNAWIRTSGGVNTSQMGSYRVTYSLTDSFGRNASTTVTYNVGDASKATISGVRKEVTKEYKSEYNLRSNITAKNSFGTVLTGNIITKIKKPGTKEYKRISSSTLKLRHTGTYRIMYYLKNPNNNLVTTKYTKLIVKDTKKPVLKSKNKFAKISLPAGTTSITYKKLLSGVTAKLISGKNMTSKISIKVTDPKGKIKTVSKNGSYKIAEPGTYTITYYCSNTEKSLRTGKYLVATKKRKMVVAKEKPAPVDPTPDEPTPDEPTPDQPTPDQPTPVQPTPEEPTPDQPTPEEPTPDQPTPEKPVPDTPTVISMSHAITVPEDSTVIAGTVIDLTQDVAVFTTSTMSDGTQQTSETTEGIQYTITYQANTMAVESNVQLEDGTGLLAVNTGIYKITYQYIGADGKAVQQQRKIIALEAQYENRN